MEIQILSPGKPLPPVQWNYEELKKELDYRLSEYRGRVYTEDSVQEAKNDRAKLNRVRDALNRRKKDIKAMYLDPYQAFDKQIYALAQMVNECVGEIDSQIRAYEMAEKEEKNSACKDLYAQIAQGYAPEVSRIGKYDLLFSKKWLNKSMSLESVKEDIARKFERVVMELSAIRQMARGAELDAAMSAYKKWLMLSDATETIKRMREEARIRRLQDGNAVQSARSIGPIAAELPAGSLDSHPDKVCIDFRVWVTQEQLAKLKDFLQENEIKYGRVPELRRESDG